MSTREITDQAGFTLQIPDSVQRIVSTVPSQTELLFDLGLGDRVVGVTQFCVHPREQLKDVTRIGGTKDLKVKRIRKLKPDLVIGNKEENIKEQINKLKKKSVPVWLSDISKFDDAVSMIREIGSLTGSEEKAETMCQSINNEAQKLREQAPSKPRKALYFIWKEPYMVAGKDTFIHEMLQLAGFETAVHKSEERYPQISLTDIESFNPDIILLSSEPYPFKTSDLHEITSRLKNTPAVIVDGEVFSWYGSRMLPALKYLQHFTKRINPYF